MVCSRCIKVVRQELTALGLPIKHIQLGKVELEKEIDPEAYNLSSILEKEGFELIDDELAKLINQIKTLIIRHVQEDRPNAEQKNLSDFLEHELGRSYSSLSRIFSVAEGRTIEKFVILQRIERVKELLVYGNKTISEIAWELGYSSSQYLSSQFKAETGLTPSEFRALVDKPRKPIDKI